MKKFISTLLIIVSFGLLSDSVALGQIIYLPVVQFHPNERGALVALYESTGGDNWRHDTNWLSDSVHHCDWFGITCNSESRVVIQIELTQNNLQGAIPAEFSNLIGLQELNLSYNRLSSLPPEFGNLTSLRYLHLIANELSSLPPEFGNLVNLQQLYLLSNDLSSLPPELGNLANLQQLNLSYNNLSSLPSELGNLTGLRTLWLEDNGLNSLPPELGNLANLRTLGLGNNDLSSLPPSWAISPTWGNCTCTTTT